MHPLAIRPAEVGHQDHRGAGVERVPDRRQCGDDPLVVGDGAGFLVLGNVEIHAHQHAFSGKVEVANTQLGHVLERLKD
jgi:hypothetical protein